MSIHTNSKTGTRTDSGLHIQPQQQNNLSKKMPFAFGTIGAMSAVIGACVAARRFPAMRASIFPRFHGMRAFAARHFPVIKTFSVRRCPAVSRSLLVLSPAVGYAMYAGVKSKQQAPAFLPLIESGEKIAQALPFSESAIKEMEETGIIQFEQGLRQLLAIPAEKRTFDNTIRAWDVLHGGMQQKIDCLEGLMQIYPDKTLRESASKAREKLTETLLNALANHPEIYTACATAQKNSSQLSEEQRYYLEDLFAKFKQMGMQLDREGRLLCAELKKKISRLETLFNNQMVEKISPLTLSREELAGVDETWLSSQKKDERGFYQLECNLPTFNAVLEDCSVRETRKKVYEFYSNRAYPQNEAVAKELIAARHDLAQLLGFSSYAAYDLSILMMDSPQRAEQFLDEVRAKSAGKTKAEFDLITRNLPKDIPLTNGKLEHYDQLYVYNCYKKKHFGVDQNRIAEYFPVDKTLEGMIDIYQQFFGLLIQEVPRTKKISGFPDDLRILEVRKQSSPSQLQGVILLDLFPREGKNTHSATSYYLSLAFSPPGGPDYPSADVVIGNFTKPSPGKPSLIKHGEVVLFFHEFGHAIHSVLGRTEMLSVAGKKVKRDFVEVPSVLLEKWMLDPGILKSISSHHETGEPLSDEMIQGMIRASAFDQRIKIERFQFLARLSLAFFAEGRDKDPDVIMKRVWQKERPHLSHGDTHFHNTWWHFTNTGAKHYFYLLAEVYAADLFETIRSRGGLRDPNIGAEYVKAILAKGGSQNPEKMVTTFLGREPSPAPFFEQQGGAGK